MSPLARRTFRSVQFCLMGSGSVRFIAAVNIAALLEASCAWPLGTPEINGSTKVLQAGLFGLLPVVVLEAFEPVPSGMGLGTTLADEVVGTACRYRLVPSLYPPPELELCCTSQTVAESG